MLCLGLQIGLKRAVIHSNNGLIPDYKRPSAMLVDKLILMGDEEGELSLKHRGLHIRRHAKAVGWDPRLRSLALSTDSIIGTSWSLVKRVWLPASEQRSGFTASSYSFLPTSMSYTGTLLRVPRMAVGHTGWDD